MKSSIETESQQWRGGVFGPNLDVRKEGGLPQIVQTRTRGDMGLKNPEIFADVLNGSPLWGLPINCLRAVNQD